VLIGPTLAEIVKFRISQPKLIPAKKNPKSLISWLPVILPFAAMCGNVAVLFFEIKGDLRTPLGVGTVLWISIRVGLIFFSMSWLVTVAHIKLLKDFVDGVLGLK
jgi:hypothetical protein